MDCPPARGPICDRALLRDHHHGRKRFSKDFSRGCRSGALPWDPDAIDDDVLRLIFIACHPVLSREAQVALTLRVVGGLGSEEIARAFLVPVATVQQRIVRAKKTLGAAHAPFELPPREEFGSRLSAVLGVLYLIFNEAHTASGGEDWMRPDLGREAVRLARVLGGLVPREPEVHGLLALMELTAARFPARVDRRGDPVLLADQDRTRWRPRRADHADGFPQARKRGGGSPDPPPLKEGLLRPAAIPAAHDETVDQQHDDRSADGQEPGRQVPEPVQVDVEQQTTQPAAEQSADDAEEQSDEPSAALLAGEDQLGDRAGDQAEEKESEEAHGSLRSVSASGVSGLNQDA